MRKIAIAKATESELRQFARDTLGIEVDANATLEAVRARVEQSWDKATIAIEDPKSEAVENGPVPIAVTDKQKPPAKGMVRVYIGVSEGSGGNDDIPLGSNGKIMLVPRGKEVDIPDKFFESLKNAVEHRFEQMPDGKGINPIPREVRHYPYQRVA